MKPSLLAFCLLLLAGCADLPEPALPDTGNPALHAVHDAELREAMAEMNRLMFERMRTETELDRDRRREALRIAAAAAALRQTVGAIVFGSSRLDLKPGEDAAFLGFASKLREQLAELEDAALRNHIDALPGAVQRIEYTCTGCHGLFRQAKPEAGPGL
jgi:hypothetical protein